jgi:DNA repair protein RadC
MNKLRDREATYGLSELTAFELAQLVGYKGSEEDLQSSAFCTKIKLLAAKLSETPIKNIRSSRDVHATMLKYGVAELPHEEFWIILLNSQNNIIKIKRMSIGGITGTVCDGRLIAREALLCMATRIILIHNHPSGRLEPSVQDDALTKSLVAMGNTINVPIADHVILSSQGFYSYADEGRFIKI